MGLGDHAKTASGDHLMQMEALGRLGCWTLRHRRDGRGLHWQIPNRRKASRPARRNEWGDRSTEPVFHDA